MTGIDAFNALPAAQAERDLLACCAAPRWARDITAGRPYPDKAALLAAAAAASAGLSWADVTLALAGHPRIGDRAAGPQQHAPWSEREQAGVAHADADVRAALAAANHAYEQRFGHVFLIFATGRNEAEILAAARSRLANDDTTERAIVRCELGKIAALRLERLTDEYG